MYKRHSYSYFKKPMLLALKFGEKLSANPYFKEMVRESNQSGKWWEFLSKEGL